MPGVRSGYSTGRENSISGVGRTPKADFGFRISDDGVWLTADVARIAKAHVFLSIMFRRSFFDFETKKVGIEPILLSAF